MKYRFSPFLLVLLYACSGVPAGDSAQKQMFWTQEKQLARMAEREDSSAWDMQMFRNDLQNAAPETGLPFTNAVFPVPYYDLAGKNSFRGVGNFAFPGGDGMQKKISGKTILYNSFYVGAGPVNQNVAGKRKNLVFFHIVVLTDTVDTVAYTHLSSQIVSRNHPDYIGQGFYKTRNNRIDYCAFVTATGQAYAIVNMRLFDLKNGRTILIAPQTDKSVRSKQLQSPLMTAGDVDLYTGSLLNDPEIIRFFTAKGTI